MEIAEVLRLCEERKSFIYLDEGEPELEEAPQEEAEYLHPVEQAALLNKEFKKTPMHMSEYVDACKGIRNGRPGYFKIRSDDKQSVWRVLVRGEIMIASYCLDSKRIEAFLPTKDFHKFVQGFRGSWFGQGE